MSISSNLSPYEKISKAIEDYYPRYYELSMDIHSNPEHGLEEFHATEVLTEELERLGFKVTCPYCDIPTAFRGDLTEDKSAPAVALLPEYDALPEIGHACGHNLIALSCMAAAVGAMEVISDLPGRLVVIGAPDEEGDGGKISLLEKGGYSDIKYALSVHPGISNQTRRCYRSSTSLNVVFHGKTSHAASSPEKGINALDALVYFYRDFIDLKKDLPREITLCGMITEGGKRTNIIPDRASAEINMRTPKMEDAEEIISKIESIAKKSADVVGGKVTIEHLYPIYKNMIIDPVMIDYFEKNLDKLGVAYDNTPMKIVGSTDVTNLSHEMAAIHPTISILNEGNTEGIAGHTVEFCEASKSEYGHKKMLMAAKAMAFTIYDIFSNQ